MLKKTWEKVFGQETITKPKFDQLIKESLMQLKKPNNQIFYLLSKQWMFQWFSNQSNSDKLNEDLIEEPNKDLILRAVTSKNQFWNINTKSGIQIRQDYYIVNKKTWKRIKKLAINSYIEIPIKICFQDINQIERYESSKFTQIIIGFNLKSIQSHNVIKEFIEQEGLSFQIPAFISILEFKKEIQHIFLVKPYDIDFKILKLNTYDKYGLEDINEYETIGDMKLVQPEKIIINITKDSSIKCRYCKMEIVLLFSSLDIDNENIAYFCSEECKNKKQQSKNNQMNQMIKFDQNKEQQKYQVNSITTDYQIQACLENLGNTCYMNSSLQCLISLDFLTKYFLQNQYINEINKDNKLGARGQLATEFYNLLINMWANTYISPKKLKNVIDQYDTQFKGYAQHDSFQFTSSFLEGLHQDLNRVKVKIQEIKGIYINMQNQEQMAKQAWINHLRLNQSIIVDYMHGQHKLTYKCLKCKNTEYNFQPFLNWSLPIPQDEEITCEIYYNNITYPIQQIKIKFLQGAISTLKDIENYIKKSIIHDFNTLVFALITNSTKNEVLNLGVNIYYIQRKLQSNYSKLCCYEMPDQNIQPQNSIKIPFTITQLAQRKCTLLTFERNLYIQENQDTVYDVQLSIFKFLKPLINYSKLFKKNEDINDFTDEELYDELYSQKLLHYKIYIDTDNIGKQACIYCQKNSCTDCSLSKIPQDYSIKKLMQKCQKNNKFQLEVRWHFQPPYFDLGLISTKITNQQIQIQQNSQGKSIYDCFKLFQQPDLLDEWYCSVCKKVVKAENQMTIYKAPKILIVYFSRFKRQFYSSYSSDVQSFTKNNDLILAPLDELDITDYVENPDLPNAYFNENELQLLYNSVRTKEYSKDKKQIYSSIPESMKAPKHKPGEQLLYKLVAVSNHTGTLQGGHYTAYVRQHKTQQWYCYNDSHISSVSPSNIISNEAYILFYEKI